jgi:Sigma-70, region 4
MSGPGGTGGAGRHSRGVTSYPSATSVLSVFVRAFRIPDLRKKLLFTGAMIVFFRFGSNLPAPGISERYLLDATVAETAAALDIAEGTVKSAASRGLDQLRQLLYEEEKRGRRVHPC